MSSTHEEAPSRHSHFHNYFPIVQFSYYFLSLMVTFSYSSFKFYCYTIFSSNVWMLVHVAFLSHIWMQLIVILMCEETTVYLKQTHSIVCSPFTYLHFVLMLACCTLHSLFVAADVRFVNFSNLFFKSGDFTFRLT